MPHKIIRRPVTEIPRWDDFISESPQGTLFHRSEFLKILSYVFNKNCEVIYAEKGDTILAAVVIFPSIKFGLSYSSTAFYIPWDGILLNPISEKKLQCHKISIQEKLVSDILKEIGKKFHYVTLKLSPDLFDLRPFVWDNWQVEPEYSVVFDLDSLSQKYDLIENSQKRKLKQIDKLDVKIIESTDSQTLFDFWSQSYAGHNRKTPLPKNQFINFVDELLDLAAKLLIFADALLNMTGFETLAKPIYKRVEQMKFGSQQKLEVRTLYISLYN